MTKEEALHASSTVVELIGNANTQISRLRREKIEQSVNKSLLPLVKEDTPFPYLFGDEFAKRQKEFSDRIKALRAGRQTEQYRKPLFRKSLPSGRGMARGRGGGPNNFRYREVVQTVNPVKARNNENFCPKNNKYYPYPEYHCGHGDSSPEQSCKLCGSSSLFSNELGISDKGPVGPKHGEGLLRRFPHSPEPAQQTTGSAIQSEPTRAVETGSRVLSDERGDKRTPFPAGGRLFLQPLSSTEERWRPEAGNQLNAFVEVPHFKMEGIHTLKALLRRVVKVDLKDAYFSIPISPLHRKYLCFTVGSKTYQFTCLPFGLASAPWVFTNTLRPVAALGRERMIIYIDDILLVAESMEKARDQASGLVYLLQCLGFTINKKDNTRTIANPRLSVVHSQHDGNGTEPPTRKFGRSPENYQRWGKCQPTPSPD